MWPSHQNVPLPVAAESAGHQRKEDEYADIMRHYHLFSLAFETLGSINCAGLDFIWELGHRMSALIED